MRSRTLLGALAILFPLATGCGSDTIIGPEGPTEAEVAGTYSLNALSFDPQGSLPRTDILVRIPSANRPTLTLTAQGGAQIVYEDPFTGLTRTVEATFETSSSGVILDFGSAEGQSVFLLSRSMAFSYSEEDGSLTFDGPAPDGVSRDVLVALVPEWEEEQLLNPTPGSLRAVFVPAGG